MNNRLLSFLSIFLILVFVWSPSVFSQEIVGKIGLHNNGYLKILKVKSYELGSSLEKPEIQNVSGITLEYIPIASGTGDYVEVLVEILRELPQGGPHKICIHYYDSKGEPVPGDSRLTQEGLSAGEIRFVRFDDVPDDAKSFRVWLPKVK